MEFNEFIGNAALKNKLRSDVESGTLPHAIIIEGADGSGKSTIARHIALMLNCKFSPEACCSCDNCKKVLGKNHADVIYVSLPEGKAQMGIESVRFIRNDVYVMPNESDYKIYIIESADKMTVEAQNAFLKIFEEPPSYAVFILLCESADALLVTVRSRGTVLRTERFDFETIRSYLVSQNDRARELAESSPDALSLAVLLSNGSIGKAIDNICGETAETNLSLYQSCSDFISLVRKRSRAYELLSYLQSLGYDRDTLNAFFSMLQNAFSDIVKSKLTQNYEPLFYLYEDELLSASASFSNVFSLEMIEIIEKYRLSLSQNANLQTTITAYAYDVFSLRYKF